MLGEKASGARQDALFLAFRIDLNEIDRAPIPRALFGIE
jgi:hypothetical protein